MSLHLPRFSVALVLVTASFACSSHKEESPAAEAPEPVRTTGADRNEATAPAIEEPAQPGSTQPSERQVQPQGLGQSATAEPLADEQTVRILTTVNGGEIEQAKLAKQQAQDLRVKKFAETMIEEHTKANDKIIKLYKKEQLLPANSSVANDLADKGAQVLSSLNNVEGRDFDKTYIDAQVQQHQEALDMIDTRLIPSAENAQLKAALEDTKTMVEHHLDMARQLQSQLAR
jgi:putative membrane protein